MSVCLLFTQTAKKNELQKVSSVTAYKSIRNIQEYFSLFKNGRCNGILIVVCDPLLHLSDDVVFSVTVKESGCRIVSSDEFRTKVNLVTVLVCNMRSQNLLSAPVDTHRFHHHLCWKFGRANLHNKHSVI